MALPSSGQITLDQIHVEAGGSSGSQATVNDTDIRDLIGKSSSAVMGFDDWYGASAANTTITLAGGGSTTTNQFGNCNATLISGNKLVVVVAMYRSAGTTQRSNPTVVTVGGQSATNVVMSNEVANNFSHINSIWVVETTLSGTQFVTGSTISGTAGNSCIVFNVAGHTTATPHATKASSNYAPNTNSLSTAGMSVGNLSTVNGGSLIVGCTVNPSGTFSLRNASNGADVATNTYQNNFSSMNHASAYRDNTPAGNNPYLVKNVNGAGAGVASFFNVVTASFK